MNLEGKSFKAYRNSINGSLNSETVMSFTSDGDFISGSYSGGTILEGHVLAKRTSENELEMLYQGATIAGEIQAGKAHALFTEIESDKLMMHLNWQWLTGDQSKGESDWEEVVRIHT